MLELRRRGGARVIGVNTVVTADNVDSVVELGHVLIGEGVNYWGLGTYLQPGARGRVVASINPTQTIELIERIADQFSNNRLPVVFEVEPETFQTISGIDTNDVVGGPWRLEHPVSSSFRVATINPEPGKWIRLRFDGQLIDKSDLLTVGVLEGRFGRYEPGKITALIQASARNENSAKGVIA
ncbi:MAG: hypothetical protein IPK83_20825 [Planctomycetes bacterium]|nr:hypothetical protein [Planctomycetota bacterium]